jgi:hypothetical protein
MSGTVSGVRLRRCFRIVRSAPTTYVTDCFCAANKFRHATSTPRLIVAADQRLTHGRFYLEHKHFPNTQMTSLVNVIFDSCQLENGLCSRESRDRRNW